jgi:hypothetical protein
MAWYADLTECDYFRTWHSSLLRAVGWLEQGKEFTRGTVDPHVLSKLTNLHEDAWEFCHFCGYHRCDLCPNQRSGHKDSVNNMFIPGDGFLYVCPELILHYINDHQYSPPIEFCEAVLACPPMNSPAYLESVEPVWRQAETP